MSDVKFHLKVMINKEKTKVLFAEIDSDFADVLLSFLTMPLGAIVRVMNNHYGDNAPVLGSLTTLYKGVSDLDSGLFPSEGAKQMLLNPRSWFNDESRKLKLSLSEPQPTRYFICEHSKCGESKRYNVGICYGTARCRCGGTLSRRVEFPEFSESASCSDDGVLTTKTAYFLIFDDMRISPYVMGSIVETLSTLGITDTKDAELRNVTLGLNEIIDLLKGMFMSSTPLTDLILDNELKGTLEFELGKIKRKSASKSKEMILKVVVRKSTNKLLFAQAEEDFVDFLFTLLTIPLGGVECLLGHNTGLETIDNFYTGLVGIDDHKYLKSTSQKSKLLNPDLPHCYLSIGQIFPLTAEPVPLVYFRNKIFKPVTSFSPKPKWCYDDVVSSFKSPKGDAGYVMGPTMYMVTDDLTVTPLSISSSVVHLNGLNIPVSDVAELEFHIGREEALSILKASLTSTSALTNGLLLLKKPAKQQKRPISECFFRFLKTLKQEHSGGHVMRHL